MSEIWRGYELDLISYQNRCRLIRGWDELFTKVKEHINSVMAMKLSPYYKVSIFELDLIENPLPACLIYCHVLQAVVAKFSYQRVHEKLTYKTSNSIMFVE